MTFAQLKTALESLDDGDTYIIPVGIYDQGANDTITTKNIILLGAGGMNGTVINGGSGKRILAIAGSNASNIFRISGITFQWAINETNNNAMCFWGSQKGLRIDNCKFINANRGIWSATMNPGVIDHCIFVDCGFSVLVERDLDQSTWGGSGVTWTGYPASRSGSAIGNGDAIFIEDCVFYGQNAAYGMSTADCMNSGKYVFRHNKVYIYASNDGAPPILVHGNQSHSITSYRGGYSAEIYNNYFYIDAAANVGDGIFLRGGTGVVFNNVLEGHLTKPIRFLDYGSCVYVNPDTGDFYGAVYPAFDQINNYYLWNNTYNSVLISDGVPAIYADVAGYNADNIRINKEYYDSAMPEYNIYPYPHPLVIVGMSKPYFNNISKKFILNKNGNKLIVG
jgi:hypothetical protein